MIDPGTPIDDDPTAAYVDTKYVQVEAVIIRKDGTRVPLGVIAMQNNGNRLRQLWWNLYGKRASRRRIEKANSDVQET